MSKPTDCSNIAHSTLVQVSVVLGIQITTSVHEVSHSMLYFRRQ